jgi:hypothetical protein
VTNIEKALSLIATLSDQEKIQTIQDNAEKRGASQVVEAAKARLLELNPPKPPKQSKPPKSRA